MGYLHAMNSIRKSIHVKLPKFKSVRKIADGVITSIYIVSEIQAEYLRVLYYLCHSRLPESEIDSNMGTRWGQT